MLLPSLHPWRLQSYDPGSALKGVTAWPADSRHRKVDKVLSNEVKCQMSAANLLFGTAVFTKFPKSVCEGRIQYLLEGESFGSCGETEAAFFPAPQAAVTL